MRSRASNALLILIFDFDLLMLHSAAFNALIVSAVGPDDRCRVIFCEETWELRVGKRRDGGKDNSPCSM
jgi:hypothetical protein